MALRAVLFDLWGTLVVDPRERSAPRQAWRTENVRAVLCRHGVDIEAEAINDALLRLIRTLNGIQDEGKDPGGHGRVDLFFELLEHEPATRLSTEAREGILEAIGGLPPEFAPIMAEGAVETLMTLKNAGVLTGLVSNAGVTTSPALRWLLEHYGLLEHLDALVFSDELGLAKPDPRIFRHVLDALNLEAAEAAFVGDAPHNDIGGALAVGLYAVQIGARTLDAIVPQARIDSLPELHQVIDRQNRQAARPQA